ncbi:MAG TPA: Zn-dependent hydrolase [Candidatus Polarisedimenticolia bacterium]|nr:Zn-dependent hydrolase [Candidatus Polarisedimenticolia bacterium]
MIGRVAGAGALPAARVCTPAGAILAVALLLAAGCGGGEPPGETGTAAPPEAGVSRIDAKPDKYARVDLSSDLSGLSGSEKTMIPMLMEAAREMDELFWLQAYGDREPLLASIADPDVRHFVEINYGPWDRLENDAPFVPGVGARPAGAAFYPLDMTREEFDTACAESPERAAALRGLYTMVRRDAAGRLEAVPYSRAFAEPLQRAASLLRDAATLADDPGLKRYLQLRAEALVTDDYRASDMAWLEMKDNTIDIVIGPIETYEDKLLGAKAAFEAYVLVKDRDWSRRLARYAELLPELQRTLPVPEEYRRETPGTDSDLNAYDVVFYAGDCNAGSKTIAINLPNDEQVQLARGTRRLQLKNAMRAKFDAIMTPIAQRLIASDQRDSVTFDAFFNNVMFHEVAHGLGVKNTIAGAGTVREALAEQFSGLEEAKADVLGLHMIGRLAQMGEMQEAGMTGNYVTFLAGILRSVRFGASSAHGRANAAQFNHLQDAGAFARDEATGTWRVDPGRMKTAIDELAGLILRLQGDGDRSAVAAFMEEKGRIGPRLRQDLDGLAEAGIPVDVVFQQGEQVLGLGH